MQSNTVASPVISVLLQGGGNHARSLKLADQLGLVGVSDLSEVVSDYVLTYSKNGLCLMSLKEKLLLPLHVGLDSAKLQTNKNDPLLRAVGKAEKIIDATAGLGRDSARLAYNGFEVIAIERNAVVYTLLADAIERLDSECMDINLLNGDSISLLGQMSADVVVLDPMYPPGRKKNARVKKELEILRDLCGDDADVDDLFDAARKCARKRVVIKRPTYASSIQVPSHSIKSKLVRYDVYVNV